MEAEISNFRLYIRTLSYFRESWRRLVVQLVLMGLGILLMTLSAFPLLILIDGVFGTHRGGSWPNRLFFALAPKSTMRQIFDLAIITLILRMAQEVLSMVQTLVGIKVGYVGLMKVRCDLFRKLQELQMAYHKSQPQGDAIYRLSYDALGFQTVLNLLMQTIIRSAITLVMMLVLMVSLNWRLTLIALSIMPLLVWTSYYYGKVFRQKAHLAKEADSAMTTAMQRSVSSIELVQAFGREDDELAHFNDTVGSSVREWLNLHWEEVCYWLVVGTIFGVGGALIFGYGGYLAMRHPDLFTAGQLVIFISYLAQFYAPLNSLSNSGSNLQGGLASVQRVFEVLDRDVTIGDKPGAMPMPLRKRKLEFDNVSFEYRPGELVLKDLRAFIEPGQMVAFVGSSGVGKTTLLNLLPRFYDPTAGALKLDGQDLRQVRLRDLRRHVAIVLQEHTVLPATVIENIAYGAPRATAAAVAKAAEMAGAADFIEKLPHKYKTIVGERGSNLSGGQRQRIGIARALLSEAPIIVLDEPTSALDPLHEAHIIQTLRSLRGQRTIIVVSHRLSTVAECDNIFVMDGGVIAEQGNHDQLLALGGVYREMAQIQFKLEPAADATAQAS